MAPHKLLTERLRAQLPPLDATQATPIADRLAVAKFFTPDSRWTWYVVEFDGDDVCYGLVDGIEREYGYFSLSEIESIRGPLGLPMERDVYFKPTALGILDASLKVDAVAKEAGGARNPTERDPRQPSHPISRITLTHRGTIPLVGTRQADGVAEPGTSVGAPWSAGGVLMKLIGKEDREHLALLMLNGAHRVLGASIVAIGTATSAPVHPREFFKIAILQNAQGVICAHNHPSGELTPSAADKVVAGKLREAGELLQIPLLDFLIVSDSAYMSFVEDRIMEFVPTRAIWTAASGQVATRSSREECAARVEHEPIEHDIDEELEDEKEQEHSR